MLSVFPTPVVRYLPPHGLEKKHPGKPQKGEGRAAKKGGAKNNTAAKGPKGNRKINKTKSV